jgi:hypothetical protein
LQWLDKIHRGAPWQTIYTGFDWFPQPWNWKNWSGSAETVPANDWKIVEMFLAERSSLGAPPASSSPVFVNNTFAANTAINGGAVSFSANATLLNNIVAQNSSGLFRLPVTNEVAVQTNCVFNNAQYDFANLSSASNNLAASPQFVGAGNNNFHLLATSPGIDAGDDFVFASGWLLNELARVQGSGVDLGAFELSTSDSPVFVSPQIVTAQNQFSFQVTGFSGASYIVERSEDLLNWIPISTNLSVNGFFTINDVTGGTSNRFYRAVLVP